MCYPIPLGKEKVKEEKKGKKKREEKAKGEAGQG